MKYSYSLAAFAAMCAAAPAPNPVAPRAAAVTIAPGSNIFSGRTIHANKAYASEIATAMANVTDATITAAAAKIAKIGTFLWIDTMARIPLVAETLAEVADGELAAFVIYDLPGRDCAAKASNGELKAGDTATYESMYIDPIAAALKAAPNVPVALIIEPDSLPNLVTNANVTACQASATGYKDGVAYALKTLNLPNVAMYVDAGHGGWLGWDANTKPGAEMLASVYKAAGSPSQVMGVSNNVAGWNAYSLVPGEFSKNSDAQYNKAQDEKTYATILGPALKTAGMPNKFIMDTGRNGVQGLRLEWGDWCNVKGAGFGVRPTSETSDPNFDAFVWVKPGGEADGTSDPTATRYDSYCGKPDAYQPSPEAGAWNEPYFEDLIRNAKPAI